MSSEVGARITAASLDRIDLNVTRERCPGCDGRCGIMVLAPAADGIVCVSKKHIDLATLPAVGQQVTVAVPSLTLISLSLLVYLTPLVLMLLSAVACFWFYSQSDAAIAICAGFGLLTGLAGVRQIMGWLEQERLTGTLLIKAR